MKKRLVFMLLIFIILLIVGSLYVFNKLSFTEDPEENDSISEIIRYKNPPVPEGVSPAGMSEELPELPEFSEEGSQ